MEYAPLGRSGLHLSRITLGCLGFGDPAVGRFPWILGEDEARPVVAAALEAGITSFDTANSYSNGTSEEVTGKILKELVPREDVVIATKVRDRMRPGPHGAGLSRKAILHEVDASLTRLGTDYIDLYQIHGLDDATPIEETMEALHDVVRAGKVRYIGASNLFAWEFAQAQYTADRGGWTRFVSTQSHYNLLYREEEREMIPFCIDQGIGFLTWSSLARGWLVGEWDAPTARSESDDFGRTLYGGESKTILSRVAEVAARREVPRAQVALAWLLAQPVVTSPIVGATKPDHIDDAVAAVELALDDDELQYLGDAYLPYGLTSYH